MSIDTTHIIKKDDVAAARAHRPEPSLLQRRLRISRDLVELPGPPDPEQTMSRRRRVPGDRAFVEELPFQVTTIAPKKGRPSTARRSEEDDTDAPPEAPTIEEIEAAWQERLDEAVARARSEGFAEGREDMRSEMQADVDATMERLASDLDAVQGAWEGYLEGAQVRLVQMALRVARVVVDAPLPADVRNISESAITDAIEKMVDGIPVEVTLHPVSYLRLQESGLEDQLAAVHSKLRWRPNPALKENEWIVQCDRAAIRRLESELLDELQRELSLRDHTPDDPTDGASDSADANDAGDEA